MANAPKTSAEKLTKVIAAWQTLRPQKKFGNMTLDEFKTKVQPSFDARGQIATLDGQRTAAIDQRDAADKASNEAIKLVVNGVRADPDEGENGELYDTMGYVIASERKSGLHRKKKVQPAAS